MRGRDRLENLKMQVVSARILAARTVKLRNAWDFRWRAGKRPVHPGLAGHGLGPRLGAGGHARPDSGECHWPHAGPVLRRGNQRRDRALRRYKWGQLSEHTGGSGGPQGGAQFPARELARVGYLALHHGVWSQNGGHRQVISAERLDAFVQREPSLEKATWRQPNFAFEPQSNRYYGHLWWNNHTGQGLGDGAPRDAFYMSGWGKQACFVVPSLDMVVVRLGPDRTLNEHPEFYPELWKRLMAAVVSKSAAGAMSTSTSPSARAIPFDGQTFRGRIAYSCDGNHNDPDDWIASPVTLAILAESGLKDRLVHFDYNCILPQTDPAWEKTHAESVLGTAERYGFDKSRFFDCRRDLDGAIASIAQAINDSTATNPLYFIIAGPMEVPYLGIQKSDPAKRQFVYCISHSRWNDGFASKYKFTFSKRSVIEQGVRWVHIRDQNRLLSFGRYGQPATPEEFNPFFWMRDSHEAKVRWLWERMLVSTRPDPSDAGMTWFLVSGDEECDPGKLRELVEGRRPSTPIAARKRVRLEAENFRHLEGFALEDRNDRNASHSLNVKLAGVVTGRITTLFDEPYTADEARYDIEVRYAPPTTGAARFSLLVNGTPTGPNWQDGAANVTWHSHTMRNVAVRRGDRLTVALETDGGIARLDYLELTMR